MSSFTPPPTERPYGRRKNTTFLLDAAVIPLSVLVPARTILDRPIVTEE
jgi:hypothetical protein